MFHLGDLDSDLLYGIGIFPVNGIQYDSMSPQYDFGPPSATHSHLWPIVILPHQPSPSISHTIRSISEPFVNLEHGYFFDNACVLPQSLRSLLLWLAS